MKRTLLLRAGLLIPLVPLLLLTACGRKPPEYLSEDGKRGWKVYQKECTICHHQNPNLAGTGNPSGPPIAGSSEELVRLRVLAPGLGFTSPTLQYYVTPGENGAATVVQREMFPSAPQPGEPLTAATRFAWSAVAGTEAYQIAFYATPAGPAEALDPARAQDVGATQGGAPGGTAPDDDPVAAICVPGDRTEASLEPFTLGQLRAERSYLWRVLAIDANGAVIGSSAAKEIFKP